MHQLCRQSRMVFSGLVQVTVLDVRTCMVRRASVCQRLLMALSLLFITAACERSTPPDLLAQMATPSQMRAIPIASAVVGPGDVLDVSFFQGGGKPGEAYLIQPDDVLSITVLDHPQLSTTRVLVLPDGYISAPGIIRLLAAGSSVETLSQALAQRYLDLKIRSPKVSVAVLEADSRLRSIMQPRAGIGNGLTMTIDNAGYIDLPFIAPVAAGRPLAIIQAEIQNAYKTEFQGRLEVTVNLRNRAPPRVFVMGEVTAPGPVAFSEPLSPIMALAAAGGFANTANREDVRLFRPTPDGDFSVLPIDVRSNIDGPNPNDLVGLRPNDVIFVPRTGVATANIVIEQYIRNMLPTSVGFGVAYQFQ